MEIVLLLLIMSVYTSLSSKENGSINMYITRKTINKMTGDVNGRKWGEIEKIIFSCVRVGLE
jgi:hypothetical protein